MSSCSQRNKNKISTGKVQIVNEDGTEDETKTTIVAIAELSNPIGWAILGFHGAYFLGNLWYQNTHNGQTITGALFDK